MSTGFLQFSQIKGFTQFNESLLRMVLLLDQAMDKVFDLDLPVESVTERIEELEPLVEDTAADITRVADQLHGVITGQSNEVLLDLSGRLSRKVRGARDALDHSADGVSQAANSLVEFIHRLLREAYDDRTVINWVNSTHPEEGDLLYADKDSGRVRPTKRAQTLCFVYGGRAPGDDLFVFNEMAAAGLVATRGRLQKLKHSDDGSQKETQDVRRGIAAVEGFIVYAVRVGWMAMPDEELTAMRVRLGNIRSQSER